MDGREGRRSMHCAAVPTGLFAADFFFFIGQVSCVSIEGLAGLTHLKRSQSLFGPVHKLRRLSGNGVSGQSLRPIKTSFMFGQNLRE